jgi:hypothetical protein
MASLGWKGLSDYIFSSEKAFHRRTIPLSVLII